MSVRERERDRETERDRERERQRQTDRDRQTETERVRDRETERVRASQRAHTQTHTHTRLCQHGSATLLGRIVFHSPPPSPSHNLKPSLPIALLPFCLSLVDSMPFFLSTTSLHLHIALITAHTYSTVRKPRPKIEEIDQVLDALDQSPKKHQSWLYESVVGKPVQKQEYEYVECSDIFRCSWKRCDHMYGSADDVLEHIKTDHMPGNRQAAKGSVRCGIRGCQEKITFDKLLHHIATKHEIKPLAETVALQCPDPCCPRVFVNSFDRDIHTSIAHPECLASSLPPPAVIPHPNDSAAAAEQGNTNHKTAGATQGERPLSQPHTPPTAQRGPSLTQRQQAQRTSATVDDAGTAAKSAKTCWEGQGAAQATACRQAPQGRSAQRKQTPQRQPQGQHGRGHAPATTMPRPASSAHPSLPAHASQQQEEQQQSRDGAEPKQRAPVGQTNAATTTPTSSAVAGGSGHLLDMYPHLSTIWRNAGVQVLSPAASHWHAPGYTSPRTTSAVAPSTALGGGYDGGGSANTNVNNSTSATNSSSSSTSGRSSTSHVAGGTRSLAGAGSLSSTPVHAPIATRPLASSNRHDAAQGMPVSQAWPVPSVYGTGAVTENQAGAGSSRGGEAAVQPQLSTCHSCGKQGKRLYKCITCERQFHKDCAEPPIRNRSRHHRCQPCRNIKSKQWAGDASPFDILDWVPDSYTLQMVGGHTLVDAHAPDASLAARWRLGHMSRS